MHFLADVISIIQKIPILTTLLSAIFFVLLYLHWKKRSQPVYLGWWLLGILTYGLGTLTESVVAIWGWSVVTFKSWYILGALLGGFPLAQGSVYLMFSRELGDRLSIIMISIVSIAAIAVIFSPIEFHLVEPGRLTGKVLTWSWIRFITPIINIYAFIFLVGGAMYSALRYRKENIYQQRFVGNVCIALGGLLPGIGGSFSKFGLTEVLYVMELLGLVLIFIGYNTMRKDRTVSLFEAQQKV